MSDHFTWPDALVAVAFFALVALCVWLWIRHT